MQVVIGIISLLGGLAMFLYGMRLMGDGLNEGASGALKKALEKVTNNPIKAFFLGLIITSVIQSSTATIVLTAGLVGAGLIKLKQSFGIIVGANVGTTVTGQIIRLLDVDANEGSILQFFQPSTLAPLSLIIGMFILMALKFKKSDAVGNVAIGFGVLFTGLMAMTDSVSALTEPGGLLENVFAGLNNPVLSFFSGLGTAFLLQSSSATIGILQAFSMSGTIYFKSVFLILVGVYLGDCVTTAIVCSIGSKADAKRVGLVNILFNLCKMALIVLGVVIAHSFGWISNDLWNSTMTSGSIANLNTVFNLACAVALLPLVNTYGKLSEVIIKDKDGETNQYEEKLASLNPNFFSSPAIAFNSCFEVLKTMLDVAIENTYKAFDLLVKFDLKAFKEIQDKEDALDHMTDTISNYLFQLSAHVSDDMYIQMLDEYTKVSTCFERLGDHASNLAEDAEAIFDSGAKLSGKALLELKISRELLTRILENARLAFENKDMEAAKAIEPLEEVVDDVVNTLHDNHLARLRDGRCTVVSGMYFIDILMHIERISDICSTIGVTTIARCNPEIAKQAHEYISSLHARTDGEYIENYQKAHKEFFDKLAATIE